MMQKRYTDTAKWITDIEQLELTDAGEDFMGFSLFFRNQGLKSV